MTKDEFIDTVKKELPQIVYLAGRTSTGKSTLARKLSLEYGYSIIELDEIIKQKIIIPNNITDETSVFTAVYRDQGMSEYVERFIIESQKAITTALQTGNVVIEGAIASPRVLNEIFQNNLKAFLFGYLHPTSTSEYIVRVMKRLKESRGMGNAGLPKTFWDFVPESTLDYFRRTSEINSDMELAVSAFIKHSQELSKKRLNNFLSSNKDIMLIEV
jgi:2-phosphoglycerate kinase